MKTRPVEPDRRTFKHIQATNIWAFVHGIDELNYEEHKHLKQCQHCASIFEYFKVYDNRGKDVQGPMETDPVGTLG